MYVLSPYKWNGGLDGTSGGNVTWTYDSTVPASFANDLQGAFTWSQYGNITFTELASGNAANIVFTYGPIDGPGNTAAVATINSSSGAITSVSILIDNAEGWTEDANGVATSAFSNVRLSTVALHEVGHGIGMDHDTMSGSIMSPTADPNINTLQQNDIQGVQAKYGQAAVCFVTGTRIRTLRGDVAVEALAVGDLAVTASGAHRPIRWIGHRSLDLRRCAQPEMVQPVRIMAHALGENRPARDLRVSPSHALCLDLVGEVLVPAIALVNSTSIVQETVERVTYWHIELDSHDILIAENQPAESYLDLGNRSFFEQSSVVDLDAGPDADPSRRTTADFCRPFHSGGLIVEVARALTRLRAQSLGWRLVEPELWSGVHLEVDGAIVQPDTRGLTARFVLPADAQEIWLVCPTSVPREVKDSPDARALGLCLSDLRVDDGLSEAKTIALDDPLLAEGFHRIEPNQRWTAGRAKLPAALLAGLEGTAFLRLGLCAPALPRWVGPDMGSVAAPEAAAA